MQKNSSRPASGFTLLETIIAVALLSLAVVAFLTVMTRGISIGSSAKDEMVASYLAQDAMEYIRAKKNENILGGPVVPWLTGFRPFCLTAGGAPLNCRINTTVDVAFATNCPGACPLLQYQDTTGIYGYCVGACAGWTTSKFRRTITMQETVANLNREVYVTVTVAFPQGSVTKTTRFNQNMFNVI